MLSLADCHGVGGSGEQFRVDDFREGEAIGKPEIDIIESNFRVGYILSLQRCIALKCSTDKDIDLFVSEETLVFQSVFIFWEETGDNVVEKKY